MEKYAPSPRRIPELDGLRVLLVFIVSWYHIWQQSWLTPSVGSYSLDYLVRAGYTPVDGTILLSGFLLFLPYARSLLMGEPMPDRRSFYRKRVMRIVPSFYFLTLVMLLAVALPWRLFPSAQSLIKDVFLHATFTFTFDAATYISTPLGVASWTLAIEVQAYLLFPFLARSVLKRPVPTLLGMLGVAWLWRGWCLWAMTDYNMVLNQLPAFLDVYALGMAAALVYVRLTQLYPKSRCSLAWQFLATVIAFACVWGLSELLRIQAASGTHSNIQAGQMIRRFPFAAVLALLSLALPFTVLPLRKLMGNRVMTFLAGISMNYYLWHQNIAVHLKRLGIPYSEYELPNQAGDRPWQYQYTFLCFGLSVLVAILATYCIEKPCAHLLQRWFRRRDARRQAQYAAQAQAAVAQLQPGDVLLTQLSPDASAAVAHALDSQPHVTLTEGPRSGQIEIIRCDGSEGSNA